MLNNVVVFFVLVSHMDRKTPHNLDTSTPFKFYEEKILAMF